MASEFVSSVNFATKYMTIYFGIPTTIMGVIGGCLNVITFLSLKTFRQSSCAFYLMIMSIFDVGRFAASALPFIVRWGFGIDLGVVSWFFCRIRYFMFTTFTLISMTGLGLAIIDQYFATSTRPRWQQWSNIKLAHRLTTIFIVIWTLHGIPFIIFDYQFIAPSTNTMTCGITDKKFNEYCTYGYYLVLTNVLPLVTTIFGLLAYHNARTLAHRTIPLVRRELDKQLTTMVLSQVLINFCTILPFSILCVYSTIYVYETDVIFQVKVVLAVMATSNFLFLSFASPFYTYVCVSKRFRRQLKYILFEIHLKKRQQNRVVPHSVALEILSNH